MSVSHAFLSTPLSVTLLLALQSIRTSLPINRERAENEKLVRVVTHPASNINN